ncbi:right-handed parallel beta-helix repeat-containing protein [Kribbella sp. NPDC055071]
MSTDIDVSEFGADPSGLEGSTEAVAAAIAYAKEQPGPTRLLFPTGTYEFFPDRAVPHELYLSNTAGADPAVRFKRFALFVDGVDDLTIDGQGSQFRLHGQLGLFAVLGSAQVTVTNFEFAQSAPRIIDLTVLETGPGYRVVQVPAGSPFAVSDGQVEFSTEPSPYDDAPYWRFRPAELMAGQVVFDVAAGLATRSYPSLFEDAVSFADLGERRLRIGYASNDVLDGLGLVYSVREVTRDTAAGFIWESERVAVTGLTARYLHGFGILGQFSTDIVVSGNEFAADREQGRVAAAFADFVQLSGVKGSVEIVGNTFDGAHDDAINVHGTYLPVVSVEGRTLMLRYAHNETAGFPQYHVGDEVELTHRSSLRAIGGGRVTKVEGPTGRDSRSLTTTTITLDTDLPADVIGDPEAYAVENVTYTPSVRIAGNTFRNLATRAVLLTTRGTSVIEGNTFDGIDMSSILITGDASGWFESGPVRDLTIRGNTFRRPSPRDPVIAIAPGNTVDAGPVHENIRIEGNTFAATGVLVAARNVHNLTIRDNHGTGAADPFVVTASTGVLVERNLRS